MDAASAWKVDGPSSTSTILVRIFPGSGRSGGVGGSSTVMTRDGLPNRVITVLDPPTPPDRPDPGKIRTSMVDVLDGPSTFQAEAASIQKLLRRYLELLEKNDRETNSKPRVRLYTHHRVVPTEGDGFISCPDGRKRIRIEALQ